MRDLLLLVDAVVNLALGVLLLLFRKPVFDALGLPPAASGFYPSILGGVLLGIGLALLIQRFSKRGEGLGLAGAITINLCGGIVLAGWLLWGGLDLPTHARIALWALVLLLVGLSLLELGCRRDT